MDTQCLSVNRLRYMRIALSSRIGSSNLRWYGIWNGIRLLAADLNLHVSTPSQISVSAIRAIPCDVITCLAIYDPYPVAISTYDSWAADHDEDGSSHSPRLTDSRTMTSSCSPISGFSCCFLPRYCCLIWPWPETGHGHIGPNGGPKMGPSFWSKYSITVQC